MPDIARGVRSFTIGTAVSRILGLARESVQAYLFGAGRSTDAFIAAFRIPNLLRDLFAETALSAAFIPVLAEERKKGKEAQNLMASNVFNVLAIIVGAVAIAGVVLSPLLVRLIAYGYGAAPEKFALTVNLTAIMFPILLLVALAAWAMSYLNTEEDFFIPSVAPAFFNLFAIAVPFFTYGWLVHQRVDPIFGMAYGVLIGGLFQFLIQIPRLYQKGFHYHFYINFKDPALHKTLKLFLPVALGLSGVIINTAISTTIISFLGERSMTWLNNAFRIMHLPLGLFGIAVGTVALPALSRLVSENRTSEVKNTLLDSLKMVLLLTVSTSGIIIFLSLPVTRIIYQHGRYTGYDTLATSQALILYMIGIPFTASIRNLAAVFYAYQDAKTPMFASFLGIAVNVGLNLLLMRALGFQAFPLAISAAALANVSVLIAALPKKIGDCELWPLVKFFMRLVIASAVAGLTGWWLNSILSRISTAFGFQLLNLMISGCLACLVFYLVGRILGLKEIDDYRRRIFSR